MQGNKEWAKRLLDRAAMGHPIPFRNIELARKALGKEPDLPKTVPMPPLDEVSYFDE